jgi:molybdopterin synthase catalytic subunit
MIEATLSDQPIPHPLPLDTGGLGAAVEFRGLVRPGENGKPISGLRYEAYEPMAVREMIRLLEEIQNAHPFSKAVVRHRTGFVPAGEAAVSVSIVSKHRAEAFAALSEFMDRLKQDVPIWKTEAVPC